MFHICTCLVCSRLWSAVYVEVDAAEVRVGAVLSQRFPSHPRLMGRKVHPCAYFWRGRRSPSGSGRIIRILIISVRPRGWALCRPGGLSSLIGSVFLSRTGLGPRISSRMLCLVSLLVRGERRRLTPFRPGCHGGVCFLGCWEAGQGGLVEVLRGCPTGLFVPGPLLPSALEWSHSSRLVCHPGVQRTLASVLYSSWLLALFASRTRLLTSSH